MSERTATDEYRAALARGRVWCLKCGRSRKVDTYACMRSGKWPKHCGRRMVMETPEEHREAVLANRRERARVRKGGAA